jgi:hypothetical protein
VHKRNSILKARNNLWVKSYFRDTALMFLKMQCEEKLGGKPRSGGPNMADHKTRGILARK